MIIRDEQAKDAGAIHVVTEAAFAGHPHSDGSEPGIVAGLRAAGALTLSLVAEEAGAIVGHVAFSPVTIDGRDLGWLGLGPISILPTRQGQGIGSGLIHEGMARLAGRGVRGIVLLGEPAFYARFGFACHRGLVLPGLPASYFMALALQGDVPEGVVAYHPAFGI